jgi:hypothetical protein
MHNDEFVLLDDEEKGRWRWMKLNSKRRITSSTSPRRTVPLEFIPNASRETAHLTSVSTL